jgi:hypothetical protein
VDEAARSVSSLFACGLGVKRSPCVLKAKREDRGECFGVVTLEHVTGILAGHSVKRDGRPRQGIPGDACAHRHPVEARFGYKYLEQHCSTVQRLMFMTADGTEVGVGHSMLKEFTAISPKKVFCLHCLTEESGSVAKELHAFLESKPAKFIRIEMKTV